MTGVKSAAIKINQKFECQFFGEENYGGTRRAPSASASPHSHASSETKNWGKKQINKIAVRRQI